MTTNEVYAMIVDIFTDIAPISLVWALSIRIYQFILGAMTGKGALNK